MNFVLESSASKTVCNKVIELSPNKENAKIQISVLKADFNISQDRTTMLPKFKDVNGFVFLTRGITNITFSTEYTRNKDDTCDVVSVNVLGK